MALRRHIVTIALAATAVVLAAYLAVIDRGRPTTGETSERSRNVFPVFRRAEIASIEVRQGVSSFRLARRDADGGAVYDLERPGAAREPADMTAVSRLMGDLELAVRERRVDVTGVDASETEVVLAMGRLSYRLRVGGPAPAPAGAAYAELEGEGTIVVRRELLEALRRSWETYRTRMLVPYGLSGAERIDIRGEGAERRLRRGVGAELGVETEHGLVRVERGAAARIASALADLRAESFADGDVQAERLVLEMTPRDPSSGPVRIAIGDACPQGRRAVRYAPAPRIDACVPEAAVTGLSASVSELADRRLFSLRPDEMEEIRIDQGAARLELARMGTGWHMRFPRDEAVDGDTGNAVAAELASLEAAEIVAKPGAFAPSARATIVRAGGAGEETVEVGGAGLVRRTADGAFLRVESDVVHAMLPGADRMRSRTVLDVDLGTVRKLTVNLDDVRQVLRRGDGGTWTMEEPKGLAVNTGLANDIAEAIGHLRAVRWAGETALAQRGKVVLERDGATETLLVGASTPGGAYARLDGRPDVFVLAGADERTIASWAIDRSAIAIDVKGAREIRVRRGDDTFTVRAPFDPKDERSRAVLDALGELRAEGVVHTGAARREEGLERPAVNVWVDRGHVAIGAGDVWRGVNVYYARRDGVDATFAVARGKVRGLVEGR